ncbi:cyclic AMP-dependent transcription factor ATF-3 isoform X2 [Hydra vulgaris]|uniref:cyclic AMP-dependent transcription factor ATF-3 isoform X2 n=1 Tax=Hydra vulgaris TaxID=6087 RepID=UPI000640C17D|nr:cyclic AMP-dependent transcription factor ATF-3 isoform X2 [Hydra vulgaris]
MEDVSILMEILENDNSFVENYDDNVDVKEVIRCSIKNKHASFNSDILAEKEESEIEDCEDSDKTCSRRQNKKNSLEDEETLVARRERNRLAAQRCRQRRRDRIEKLEKICQRLECDGSSLENEISELQKEMSDLQQVLTNHKCHAKINTKFVTKSGNKTETYIPTL